MVSPTRQSGFTLIEVMVVLAIIAILFGLSTINLGSANVSASKTTTVNTLLADLRSQQILAMSGDMGGSGSQQPHGIYIGPSQYTLFAGSSYNAGDPNNFIVHLNTGMQLSTTLPSNVVIFDQGDGGVSGYSIGSDTITTTYHGSSQTITINRFGATVVN